MQNYNILVAINIFSLVCHYFQIKYIILNFKESGVKKVLLFLFLGSSLSFSETVIPKTSWGVEFNPFRVLVLDSDWQSFSGTISHFDNENGIEIAMPILYSKEKNRYYNDIYEDTETALNIDLHYRKYFSRNRTQGAYLGAFGRYTYLDGKVNYEGKYATVEKFGVGGEIGYRVKDIFDTPFYWGASLSLGGYIGGDNDIYNSSGLNLGIDDNKLILDIELLKVGYEF